MFDALLLLCVCACVWVCRVRYMCLCDVCVNVPSGVVWLGCCIIVCSCLPEWCLMCVTCVVYDVMSCVFAVVLLCLFSVVAVCVRACVRLKVFV